MLRGLELAPALLTLGSSRVPRPQRPSDDTVGATLGSQPSLGGVVYEHLESTQEPLLWIPDGLGWCYGAGGDWRRRVASAINAVIDCDHL